MDEAVFRYRCRSCNKVYGLDITSPDNAKMYLICTVTGYDLKLDVGMLPRMLEVHNCSENESGVSDLIGYKVVDNV